MTVQLWGREQGGTCTAPVRRSAFAEWSSSYAIFRVGFVGGEDADNAPYGRCQLIRGLIRLSSFKVGSRHISHRVPKSTLEEISLLGPTIFRLGLGE